jgi:hypothetical protein
MRLAFASRLHPTTSTRIERAAALTRPTNARFGDMSGDAWSLYARGTGIGNPGD